jgi:hypothetical protein
MIMLIILSISIVYAKNPDNQKSILLLKKSSAVLKEERVRWKGLHESPNRSEAVLIEDSDSFTVKITIDPVVKNIVNDQPITREYKILKDPGTERGLLGEFINDVDIYLCASYSISAGVTAGLLAGYNPEFIKYAGVGLLFTPDSAAIAIYGNLGKLDMKHVIIGVAPGICKTGYDVNYFIGVQF